MSITSLTFTPSRGTFINESLAGDGYLIVTNEPPLGVGGTLLPQHV